MMALNRIYEYSVQGLHPSWLSSVRMKNPRPILIFGLMVRKKGSRNGVVNNYPCFVADYYTTRLIKTTVFPASISQSFPVFPSMTDVIGSLASDLLVIQRLVHRYLDPCSTVHPQALA